MRIIGIDGCKAGWVVASADEHFKNLQFTIVERITEVLQRVTGGEAIVCIDIPIGLPDTLPRTCDLQARRLLQKRRSSVFPAPSRASLDGRDYDERCRLNVQACGKALSQQASAIIPKIREVDLAMRAEMQSWVREVHPEVCFATFVARLMEWAKKSREGEEERLASLRRKGLSLDPSIIRASLGASSVQVDDIVDAAAALITAQRIVSGRPLVLGGERDSRGLRMEMVA